MLQIIRALAGPSAALTIAVSCLAGCAASAATCASAGGTFANGACTLSGPDVDAMKRRCQERGAPYLAGSNTCAYGIGQ